MNKIVASLGIAALGASGIQAVYAQDLGAPQSKPWDVTATLRGFYDDNVNTAHQASQRDDSFGYELSPGVSLKWSNDATTAKLAYTYSYKFYENKPDGNSTHYDQNHIIDAMLDHAFSERYKIGIVDSFVVGQEPDLLRGNNAGTSQVISGDNIRNYGTITFNAQMTPLFGLEVGYGNSYFNYDDSFNSTPGSKNVTPTGTIIPSNSGTLDRIESKPHIEGQWTLTPQTLGIIGYQFEEVDYTADELIAGNIFVPASQVKSDDRNRRSQIGYIGADHKFSPQLSGSIRAGIQYNDYYNDPNSETDFSPYVRASASYVYAPESSLTVGFKQDRTATDVAGSSSANVVTDTDTSLLYASLRHRIVPNLFGSVIGTFQNSIFNGGGAQFNNKSQQFYELGVNLQYKINSYFSTEIGYDYDNLNSEIPNQAYVRNRVYIGITASY